MIRKNYFLFVLMFSLIMVLSACSDDDNSAENDETADTEEAASDTQDSNGENLIVSGDTVSEQGGCVLASRFSPGDKIIFRMNAVDGATNEQVEDANLQVHLSTGETLDMEYGEHGDDNIWVVAYPITEDTPTGTLNYHVTADAGDQTGEFEPFNVEPSLLTIVSDDEVAAQNDEGDEEENADTEEATETDDVETTTEMDIVATDFEFNEDVWYVKAGEEVTVTLTNEEGTHGVAIDGQDVSLDEEGTTTFTPSDAGEFDIHCSVFCGTGHSDMTSKLVVVE
jgi:plastocyanin